MKNEMQIDAAMVKSTHADLSIMAAGVLNHLEQLKQDPDFMREFEEWKRKRKEVSA